MQADEPLIEKKKQRESKKYTIKELLANDDSDEEGYKDGAKSNWFPYLKNEYKNIYDELQHVEQDPYKS